MDEELREKLKNIIDSSNVVLFMKGEAEAPACGFSEKIVDELEANGIEFNHFNILEDDEVRQGLKEYSNWPTFPQLYINGKLVGGCDIVSELSENGELKKMAA